MILLATGRESKIRSWNDLMSYFLEASKDEPLGEAISLDPNVFKIVGPREFGVEPIDVAERDDPEATYADNAYLKAKAYWDKYHIPVLADDSGLEIFALDKWPGIITARCGGTTDKIASTVIDKCKHLTSWEKRKARYVTDACFIDSRGVIHNCFTYRNGYVATSPRGTDCNQVESIFIPETQISSSITSQLWSKITDDYSLVFDTFKTLGELPKERSRGQNYQTLVMTPITLRVPVKEGTESIVPLIMTKRSSSLRTFFGNVFATGVYQLARNLWPTYASKNEFDEFSKYPEGTWVEYGIDDTEE